MVSIGLMGGTFDPIHWGHLILAEQARERFSLETVLFVTAADPPHKPGQVVAGAEHRHEMTCLAVRGNDHFDASAIEIDRPGPSYTIDTLKRILDMWGHETSVRLLVGADEARDMMTWRDPYGIQKLATIVVANRPGHPVEEALAGLPGDFAGRVEPLEIPGIDISSTDIRERVRSGRSIRYLVPEPVESYISRMDLYRGKR